MRIDLLVISMLRQIGYGKSDMANSTTIGVLLLSWLLVGCSSDNPPATNIVSTFINQDEHTYYEQVLAPGNECITDGIFNCTADLYLCSDGSAFLLLTDIVNDGSYTEGEDSLETQWGFGDAPERINFAKQADFSLIDDAVGLTWNKVDSDSIADWCEP